MPTFYEEIHFDYIHPLAPNGLEIDDDIYHNYVRKFRQMSLKELNQELKNRRLPLTNKWFSPKLSDNNKITKFCILVDSFLNNEEYYENFGIKRILWDIYEDKAIIS